MGWNNPPVPWRELERTLSGGHAVDGDIWRPRPADGAPPGDDGTGRPKGDGGDSPAWSHHRAAYSRAAIDRPGDAVPYAELHAHTAFSHLDGAATPEEMVEEAARLGLSALAITDHDGMYGLPRFAQAAQGQHMPTIVGAELALDGVVPATRTAALKGARAEVPDPPGRHLLVLARGPQGYARLCRAISAAHRRGGAKGHVVHDLDELTEAAGGEWLVLTGCRKGPVRSVLRSGDLDPARRALAELVERFGRDNVAVELAYAREPEADERYAALTRLAEEQHLRTVATTGAHYDHPDRRHLATVLAAVRARRSLDEMDGWLPAWADAHLRSGGEMAQRFRRWPGVVDRAAELGRDLQFDVQLVAPKLPPFPVPPGFADEMAYLRHLTDAGARERWGEPTPEHRERLEHELGIIEEQSFAGYFLVVWDIARFCRENDILCQGRGSAAGSAVCFALRVTAIDPVERNLLFERFLAPDRDEPPDIDLDIESGDPRESVIQYVYARHGRDNAAQVANAVIYRPKNAVRDVARALGFPVGVQDAWSKQLDRWSRATFATDDPDGPTPLVQKLVNELIPLDAPRHLGIHSGGMVICDRPVVEVCPVEWARMPNRTVLQWDKDDCEFAGLVKFDLLGLGMLRALRLTFAMLHDWHGVDLEIATIPSEQPCVYDMVGIADTVGVFQIESRAQMQSLPRTLPRSFYDLAIQVALIRPGPIQGGAVHPYVRRRNGDEPVSYPHPSLEPALKRTLGVPLFQEQLMEIAVYGAGFSPKEADRLRRAMGSKRGVERIDAMEDRLRAGLTKNGIVGAVADDVVARIKAFAAFGFAESHALSFALLVYASCWLKLHYPAAFLAGLLNSQPMGFYAPQSLVHDAKRHGLVVHRPDVLRSLAGASLEAVATSPPAAAPTPAAPTPAAPTTAAHGSPVAARPVAAIWRDAPDEAANCPHLDAGHGDTSHDGAGPEVDRTARCRCGKGGPQPAVRLGLASVRGFDDDVAQRIVDARAERPFASIADLARRADLTTHQVEMLASAGALDGLGVDRRTALWVAGPATAVREGQLELDVYDESAVPDLPPMTGTEELVADFWTTGVTTGVYPTAVVREHLDALGIVTAMGLRETPDRSQVVVGGVVTHRQRPTTGGGTVFLSLEDETGVANVICRQSVWDRDRRAALGSSGLLIRGRLERAGQVANVLAESIEALPLPLNPPSRDFR